MEVYLNNHFIVGRTLLNVEFHVIYYTLIYTHNTYTNNLVIEGSFDNDKNDVLTVIYLSEVLSLMRSKFAILHIRHHRFIITQICCAPYLLILRTRFLFFFFFNKSIRIYTHHCTLNIVGHKQ